MGKNRNKKPPDGSDINLYYLYSDFFQNEVLNIIEDLPILDSFYFEIPPIYSIYFIDTHWFCFSLLTSSMVLSLMSYLKSISPLDPLPLNLLRILSPYLIDIIRLSLSSPIVPQSVKYAYITPISKKHNLDFSKPSNYRPVSQLSSM